MNTIVKKIISDKLFLSPLEVDDARYLNAWLNDPEIAMFYGSYNRNITAENQKEWISKSYANQFLIYSTESNSPIGYCGLTQVNHLNQSAELNILIGDQKIHNNGFGTLALNLLLSYSFSHLNLNNIIVKTLSSNKLAINFYKKNGFKMIGLRRECYFQNYELQDLAFLDITKKEFYKLNFI